MKGAEGTGNCGYALPPGQDRPIRCDEGPQLVQGRTVGCGVENEHGLPPPCIAPPAERLEGGAEVPQGEAGCAQQQHRRRRPGLEVLGVGPEPCTWDGSGPGRQQESEGAGRSRAGRVQPREQQAAGAPAEGRRTAPGGIEVLGRVQLEVKAEHRRDVARPGVPRGLVGLGPDVARHEDRLGDGAVIGEAPVRRKVRREKAAVPGGAVPPPCPDAQPGLAISADVRIAHNAQPVAFEAALKDRWARF